MALDDTQKAKLSAMLAIDEVDLEEPLAALSAGRETLLTACITEYDSIAFRAVKTDSDGVKYDADTHRYLVRDRALSLLGMGSLGARMGTA